ncbi:MAG: hypothetical protein HY907_09095 [Deltaproteobacteria bacterium]|nr:hypothetical protein [Deltaproteobacteria bacterium]
MPIAIAKRLWDFLWRNRWLVLSLLAVVAFFTPLLMRWSMCGQTDWGYFHFLDEVARRTVLDFGEAPEWNPYYCGGNVLAANTQAHVWSPWFVFPLIFGPAAGIKISVLLHGLIGAAGMWMLLGATGIRGPGRFLGTVLFACAGFFGHQIAAGHVWALPFYYLPFVVLFLLRGCHELRWSALAGAFWGLMAMEGGVYPAPYTGVLVGAVLLAMVLGWTPLEGRPRARWWRVFAAGGICLVAFFLFAAAKLLPDLYHMVAVPREAPEYPRMALGTLLDSFTWRNVTGTWDKPSHHDWGFWGEYSTYVGWAGLALCAGAVVLRFRHVRVLLVMLALSLSLTMGALGPGTPWDLLHRLPVFENLRVPSRFLAFAALILAWFAAIAVSEGEKWLRAHVGRGDPPGARPGGRTRLGALLGGSRARWVAVAIPAVVAVGLAADTTSFNAHAFYMAFSDRPLDPDRPPAPMEQIRGSFRRMGDHVAANHGTMRCQEINSVPRSRRVGEQGREYGILEPASGTVHLIDWSPNEINLDVELSEPATVWVNQNYYRGWSSDMGKVEPLDNQLTVRLPAGRHRVRLFYRAPGLRAGLLLTGLGVVLLAGWFIGDRRWRKEKFSVVGSPSSDPDPGPGFLPTADRRTPTAGLRRLLRYLPNAGFALAALAVFVVPILVAEPGDPVWQPQVREYVRPRLQPGDVVLFTPIWPSAALGELRDAYRLAHNAVVELGGDGWERLWLVYCRRDGDKNRLKNLRERFVELDRRDVGHYTVYLFGPKPEAPP